MMMDSEDNIKNQVESSYGDENTIENKQLHEQRLLLKQIIDEQKKKSDTDESILFGPEGNDFLPPEQRSDYLKFYSSCIEEEIPSLVQQPCPSLVSPSEQALEHNITGAARSYHTLQSSYPDYNTFGSYNEKQLNLNVSTLMTDDTICLNKAIHTSSSHSESQIVSSADPEKTVITSNIVSAENFAGDSNCDEVVTSEALKHVTVLGPECLSQPISKERKLPSGKKAIKKSSAIYMACEWCLCVAEFRLAGELLKHIEGHLEQKEILEDSEALVCEWRGCEQQQEDLTSLKRHVYYHGLHSKLKANGQRLIESKEEVLPLDVDCQNILPQIPEIFDCRWANCSSSYLSAQHFYWHVEEHVNEYSEKYNTENKSLVCSWSGCSYSCKKLSHLKGHIRSHTQEKEAACPYCGALYASKTKLFDHLNKQATSEKRLYQCSCCSRKYSCERLLREHMRYHINHFKCPHCDMTCTSAANLRTHINFRHRKQGLHQCIECGKSFVFKLDLERHLLIHTKEKPYKCVHEGCSLAFRGRSELDRHLNLVHPSKVYACHLCPEERSSGSHLSKHLMSAHSITWPSGHSRFTYRVDSSGKYRLQTVRYEILELAQSMEKEPGQE